MALRWLSALAAGALFGIGLVWSGMTDPRIVQGFLDVAGRFDARLLLVLGGAVGVTGLAFRWILRQPAPRLDRAFQLPTATRVDRRLLVGAGLFGIGWGLAGYCPGPGLVGLAGGAPEALWFVPAMLAGSLLQRFLERLHDRRIALRAPSP